MLDTTATGAVGHVRLDGVSTRAIAIWEQRSNPTEIHAAKWIPIATFQAPERLDPGVATTALPEVEVGSNVDLAGVSNLDGGVARCGGAARAHIRE